MDVSRLGRRALSIVAAAAALTGCNGVIPGPQAPGARDAGITELSAFRIAALTMPHYEARRANSDRSPSWVRPEATRLKRLLYGSDWFTNDVYIYDYDTGTLVGTLTGFSEPYAQCVDARGDVWIANFGGSSLVEYAHGGSKRIGTLATDGYTIGCAVDKNGDVAAANFSTKSGSGDVQVFTRGSGTPATYSSKYCYYVYPPGYDDKGNLFVEGEYSSVGVCELPAGGTSLAPVSFDQQIYFPGGAMWDGKYMTFTDQEYGGNLATGIYQANVSASGLTVAGSTPLTDPCSAVDVVAPFIVGQKNTPVNRKQGSVAIGSVSCSNSSLAFWHYPAGGNPFEAYAAASTEPIGESVSIKP